MQIAKIWFNGVEEPLGYHFTPLIVSWLVEGAAGEMQASASLQISADPDFTEILYGRAGDLDSLGVAVELDLQPRTTYFVRIDVYSDQGSHAQAVSRFETGKLAEPWEAEWIGPQADSGVHPRLLTDFAVHKPLARARLYITGLGLYEAYLNGEKVGDEVLTPLVNNYDAFIQVQTYDVTRQIGGQNELSILLGNGWYKGRFGLQGEQAYFGSRFAAIAELILTFTDGEERKITTDQSWHCTGSSIIESGIYDGELIDRTIDVNADTEGQADILPMDKSKLMDRISPPLRLQEMLPVQKVLHSPAGETILDFGQNFAGWLEFTADFPAGHTVRFEFGEILQNDRFYNDNYGTATAGFTYISGGSRETVTPHFTYFGFRYVRVTGWDSVTKEDVLGRAIYSDLERTGYVETGNAKLNQLYSNSLWGLKSNFLDMPTDCPQRAERLGWTGDAQVFAPAASYHMDTRAFYRKYLFDMRTEQLKLGGSIPNYMPAMGTGGGASVWGDAATLIPATLLKNYGSVAEAAQYYPLMKDWVDYLGFRIEDKHGTRAGLNDGSFQFGDWLALDGATPSSFKGGTDDTYIATVYYYESLRIVGDLSGKLGRAEEAEHYSRLAGAVKEKLLFEYYTPAGRLSVDTQSAYIIALKFAVCTDKQVIINQLKNRIKRDLYKIRCGFVGAPIFCQVLAENGMADLAYDFLLQEDFPGWLYAVNLGATTIWERWNSVLPDGSMNPAGMNSLNHYSYGAVMEFVYEYAAGIRPDGNGFRKLLLAPQPHARLGRLSCRYKSTAGTVGSSWSILDDGQIHCRFEVPFNAEATIILPYSDQEPVNVTSGIYEYTYQPQKDLRTIYDLDTRVIHIKKDEAAFEQLLTVDEALTRFIRHADEEQLNMTIREISGLFFTGVTQEAASRAALLLSGLKLSN
ncbi:family 78 glycoside hydrolase catalytic domain [Paenibacillus sp. MMS20-IR301]|uniref:alpha-L-rhamnosidase n=1 Tax=Paenibacillus sp. MMS20-IR301 TaxID=2895946 RepID=UPI0028EFD09D|nr:family 78 glycoside hydrolase catalytic domain [Paenibacillus sp. MMS20-IR301]WNS40739.1 family 78 glycoside hydrolase catalytic domain [Paenibacillus sp. MMS20-IR301]